MSVRYVLAPQAALDLVEIWRYIKNQASLAIADRVESAIREKIVFLAGTPGAGHSRKDLTGIHTIIGYLGYPLTLDRNRWHSLVECRGER